MVLIYHSRSPKMSHQCIESHTLLLLQSRSVRISTSCLSLNNSFKLPFHGLVRIANCVSADERWKQTSEQNQIETHCCSWGLLMLTYISGNESTKTWKQLQHCKHINQTHTPWPLLYHSTSLQTWTLSNQTVSVWVCDYGLI